MFAVWRGLLINYKLQRWALKVTTRTLEVVVCLLDPTPPFWEEVFCDYKNKSDQNKFEYGTHKFKYGTHKFKIGIQKIKNDVHFSNIGLKSFQNNGKITA